MVESSRHNNCCQLHATSFTYVLCILNTLKTLNILESKTQSEITDAQMDKLRKLGEAAGVK